MSLEAYKRELMTLRERDMAITKPTQPEYFARSRRPAVQIASPSYDPSFSEYDLDLTFLDDSYYTFPSYLMTSPTDTDIDTCDFDFDIDPTYISQPELDELVAQVYPNGVPGELEDSGWGAYQDEMEMDSSIDISAEDGAAPMAIDDDSLQTLFEEFDNVFGDVSLLSNSDSETNSSSDSAES
jgi:hypothetical protein